VSKVAKKGLGYTQTGTPYYASPEVWRDQPYDIKSDIWSLGCVLYEMITLKPPFRAPDMQSLYKKVLKGIYPRIPTSYSQDLAAIVKHLLQFSHIFDLLAVSFFYASSFASDACRIATKNRRSDTEVASCP
jgi:NIMA (never in mitosis gene a)-related kinase